MNYIIKINGYKLELDREIDFDRVIQRNTIGNLASRQSTFTSTIPVYKTAKNYEFFEFLDVAGVNTDIPYIVLRAQILNESGMAVNLKGRAFIEMVTKEYINLNIYDGYIDFLKSIKNKSLNDLDLSLLNHQKNVPNVVDSWNDDKKYIYLLSDFNGKNKLNGNLNIDYQNPSGSVEYIWNQIFNFAGYTFTGSVFQLDEFKNLYISYPRPVSDQISTIRILSQKNNFNYEIIGSTFTAKYPLLIPNLQTTPQFENNPKTSPELYFDSSNNFDHGTSFTPTGEFVQSGLYRLSFSGSVLKNMNDGSKVEFDLIEWWTTDGSEFFNVINPGGLINTSDSQNNYADINVNAGEWLHIFVRNLNEAGDAYFVSLAGNTPNKYVHDEGGDRPLTNNLPGGNSGLGGITTRLEFFEGVTVDFDKVFNKIKIRDFLKEIMIRFALTPYPDHKRKKIDFLTIDEVLGAESVDYSDNLIEKESTEFVYNDYAQKNYLRFKYSDKEADHFDGSIDIENENLDFENELYNSFLYAPEEEKSFLSGFGEFLKSKIWEREINEDSQVEYDELDGRFYLFLKKADLSNITVTSEELGNTVTANGHFRASFETCSFDYVLENRYPELKKVIDKSKVRNVVMKLTELEFMQVDIKKKVYLKQYGSDFLINRIKNRSSSNEYNFELVEINVERPETTSDLNPFYLDTNGVTVKLKSGFSAGVTGTVDGDDSGTIYTAVDETMLRNMDTNTDDFTKVCTTQVGDMNRLFKDTSFNQNINSWDVSNVYVMELMFHNNTSFNQPLDNWDVGNVLDMRGMFYNTPFNQFINGWDVSNVRDMRLMFKLSAFNMDIYQWDVSSVTKMALMFMESAFNKDIGGWDVSNVLEMGSMFANNLNFNQNISNWCVEQITSQPTFFATNSPIENDNTKLPNWGATC